MGQWSPLYGEGEWYQNWLTFTVPIPAAGGSRKDGTTVLWLTSDEQKVFPGDSRHLMLRPDQVYFE